MVIVLPGEVGVRRVVVNLTDRALITAFGNDEVISWDLAGRLYSTWNTGITERRGLNGRGLRKWHDVAGRHREPMDAQAIDRLVDRAADRARAVAALVERSGGGRTRADAIDGIRHALVRAAQFDAAAARSDARRFASIYGEIGILPPDQYLAFVAQATEGCSFGTCTFCDLYQQSFRVRAVPEFATHLADARAFLGDSLLLRGRSVFIGAANALAVTTTRLLPLLDVVNRAFDRCPPAVCGFIDAFAGARKTADEYRALANLGLRRVYVGLESGSDRVLAFVRKPARSEDAIQAVGTMKAAGLSVAVIVIVGIGGDRFAEEHTRETAVALHRMKLGSRDLVYFSDLVEERGNRYVESAEEHAIRPLSTDERRLQRRHISEGLTSGVPPRTATYDLREFVY